MRKKQMLIVIGPQGSGNHLWSKIFSLHPEVYGWKSLIDNYWESHRRTEPFKQYWNNPNLLKSFNWDQCDYYFTNISYPLGNRIHSINAEWFPDILEFINAVKDCGINVQLAICGRDQTILQHQQTRVRGKVTLPAFFNMLEQFQQLIFLSYELLYLYKIKYINSLAINIPISDDCDQLLEMLCNDANTRYIHPSEPFILDLPNKDGLPLKQLCSKNNGINNS